MDQRLVSFDLGNGYVKARSSTVQGISYPAVISVIDGSMDFDIFGSGDKFIIGFEGQRLAIGDTVRTEGLTPVSITHRSRVTTEFYRKLFASALAATVKQSAVIKVVLSLPPDAYWDKDKLKVAIAGTYEVGMMTKQGWKTFVYEVPIENIRVIPEGVGALCVLALDEQGRDHKSYLAQQSVGIVDVGTYTTDLIMLAPRMQIVKSGTRSHPHALKDIHQKLITFAAQQGVDLDSYKADEVLKNGYFLRQGLRVQFSKQVESWTSDLASAIGGLIRSQWNGADDVESIIVAGGGGLWIYDYLALEFPHVELVTEHADHGGVAAHLANCEGAYRYGLLKEYAAAVGR